MIDLTPYTDSNGDIDLKKELIQNLAGIVTSGSNTNGSYVMFSDGTQICYFTVSCSYINSVLLRGTWTFPASFIENPTIVGAKNFPISAKTINSSLHIANTSTTNTTIDLVQIVTTGGSALVTSWVSGDVYGVACIAIGRWK